MLEMIKAKQNKQMRFSEAELLNDIGGDILKDLESSLQMKREGETPKNDESRGAER
jgi:hypothetical protein